VAAADLILLVAGVLAVGVAAQVVSDWLRVPSIIFFLAAGIALGPEGLGFLTQTTFGTTGLSAIVGLSVAIIVFEGAFHLHLDRLRAAPSATIKLVTLGAAIALVGTAVAIRFALGAEFGYDVVTWELSFLIGALLVATGPTVIAPILEVVPVRDRVGAALETEGIVNDVSAAILAVVMFEVILLEGQTNILGLFVERLGVGLLVGLVVAGVLYYGLQYVDLSPGNAPQNARLLVLAGALVAYAVANGIRTEAGVAAVATGGFVLGNADIPYEEDIAEFKGDITLIVLSFVFIALASLLEFQDLVRLGIGGVIVVVAVALLIRPLLVFVSTRGDRFTTNEKLFMSFVGPRGIIPASVATLFAIEFSKRADELRDAGEATQAAVFADQSGVLVGTVFLVILATVVFEAGIARQIAEKLDVIPMRVLVVGGGKVGRSLAERLLDRGENVVLIEQDVEVIETARNEGYTVHKGDGTDTEVLRSAGAENAKIIVAATGDDDSNLLVAQLASSKFDVEEIIARANNPDNVDAFEDLGVNTISPTDATAWAIDNAIERPAMSRWMTQLGRSGDVQEVTVTSNDLIGRTVREIGPDLPDGCLIALVSRDGEITVPEAEFTIQEGDSVTILGRKEAVREAMAYCSPE